MCSLALITGSALVTTRLSIEIMKTATMPARYVHSGLRAGAAAFSLAI